MLDMHSHILPGVDDGVPEIEQSIKIISRGLVEGIETFVLTPHIREGYDKERIDNYKVVFEALKKELVARGIEANLLLGAENAITPDITSRLRDGTALSIAEKYVLVELPYYQLPNYTDSVFFNLMVDKYIPVIAHPERYMYLAGNLDKVREWADRGVKLQVNSASIGGKYGWKPKRLAKKLVKNGLIHFVGSDAHSPDDKYYHFTEALAFIEKAAGKDKLVELMEALPPASNS